MCKHRQPYACARVEGPRSSLRTSRAGCIWRTAGTESVSGVPAAFVRWRNAGRWSGICRNRLILSLAFRIGGPNNYVPIEATPSLPVLLFTLAVSSPDRACFWYRTGGWRHAAIRPRHCGEEQIAPLAEAVRGHRRCLCRADSGVAGVVSAAALLSRSLQNLEHQNFGFETKDRYIA